MPPIFMLGGGEPLTPEQKAEAEKEELRQRANTERTLREALPHVQAARAAIRELTRLGFSHPDLTGVRHRLATIADDVQAYLEAPPPTGG